MLPSLTAELRADGASVEHNRIWMNSESQLHMQGNAGCNVIGNVSAVQSPRSC